MQSRCFLRLFLWIDACVGAGVLALACAADAPASAAETAAGDVAWTRRGDDRDETGKIRRTAIDEAITHYEAALALEPKSFALRFKLMEAEYFLGHFVLPDNRARRTAFKRSLALTEEMMALLAEEIGKPDLARLPVEKQIELLKNVPKAAPTHFWAAINWGLWGLASGYFAAGREGVATRIRDHATILIGLDEKYADGGGFRILGRLHTVTPRIPFATWWLDRLKGIEWLRRAHTISRRDARNALFLAEALLEHAPDKRTEALDLLREAAAVEPDPSHMIEDMETNSAARERLKKEEAPHN